LNFDELMKRDIQYCFSVLFLFIGYSSIFHQRMKGNEKNKSVAPRENAISLFPRRRFFLTAKSHDEKPMNW